METLPDKRHGVKDVVASDVSVLSVVAMFYAICCAGAFGIEEMIPECGPGLTIVMLVFGVGLIGEGLQTQSREVD